MWKKLKQDEEFQIAVQANIAMAFKDAANLWKSKKQSKELTSKDLHIIANAAASYFVDLVCDQNPFDVSGDGAFKNVALLSEYLKRENHYLNKKSDFSND